MRVFWVLVVVLLSGCVQHLHTNAPGHIDPTVPPRQIEIKGVEVPKDPGEHVLSLRSGTYVLVGGLFDQDGARADRGVGHIGLELSASFYELEASHGEREHGRLLFAGGRQGDGGGLPVELNLGWTFIAGDLETDAVSLGPVYVEAQHTFDTVLPLGVAAGIAVDPIDGRVGPQVSAWFMTMFARATWLVGGDVAVLGGMVFKIPSAVTWSR